MSKLEILQELIIGDHILNNLRYAFYTMLIRKGNVRTLIDGEEGKREVRNYTLSARRKNVRLSRRKNSKGCKLQIADTKMEKLFKYMVIILTNDRKFDTETRRRDLCLPKSNHRIKKRTILFETKKRVLSSYVISVILYGSECLKIPSMLSKNLETTEKGSIKKCQGYHGWIM